jgi:uncharacterized protein (TIGR02680 family)
MTIAELPLHGLAEEAHDAARWHPVRAGILNVWRYYDEVFEFHNGRLLLRGPNGTGKSKALELLLPYLFDASLRPNRLSTFGTSERTMHWNLMGEGATGTTRVGYVWLEFARGEEFFTCGARLQATKHTTKVTADYFTTSLRVDADISLKASGGQPLTRAALVDGLGEDGVVHPDGQAYREAVRQTLFPRLSAQRFEALITALLQLRTPKLSQRLDPGLLSTLLSRALPPLDQEDIAELAEGFERLDQQRERLEELDGEIAAAKKVADRQRSYAQRVLVAAADRLTSATRRMDDATRAARESEEQHHAAQEQLAADKDRQKAVESGIDRARSRIDGIKETDAYKDRRELVKLREAAAGAQQDAQQRATESQRRSAEAETYREEAERTEALAREAETRTRAAAEGAGQAARRAGLESTHHELTGTEVLERFRPLLNAAVRRKFEAINLVRAKVREHESALSARRDAEQHLERARSELSDANDLRDTTAAEFETAVREHGEELVDWSRSCVELAIGDPAELVDRADSETELLSYVNDLAQRHHRSLAAAEASASARRDEIADQRSTLAARLDELRGKVDLPPDPPPHRTADRTTAVGAPLWQLVEFDDAVPQETRAAVEAALQAGGLLDAWVSPSGATAIAGHDTVANGELLTPAPGRSLREILRPEPDSLVPAERVERLLSAIAFDETLPADHPAACGADGRWRLGTATGSWDKTEVEHIGAAARERARQARIAQLSAELAELDRALAELEAQKSEL